MREFVGGELPLFSQVRRRFAETPLAFCRAPGERLRVGGFGQRRDAGLRFGEQRRQRVGAHAMLARHVVDRGQPVLDALQFVGVDVEPPQVVAQRAGGFVELDAGGLEQAYHVRERGIVRGDGTQPLRQLRDARPERVVGVRQRRHAVVGRGNQLRRVGQARLRGRQVAPFGLGHGERGQLAPAIVQEIALGGRRFRRMRGGIALVGGDAPFAPAVGHFARERREAAEGVDQIALRFRRGERLVRVLAVDGDELLAQLLQLRDGGGAAVDPGAAAALRIEHPPQQHFVAIGREVVLVEPRAHGGDVGDVESCRQFGALGTGAQLPQFEAIAEQQSERIEQYRLAGTRLARQDGESVPELDVELGDDHEVANGKRTQHGQSLPGPVIRSGVALQCSFSRSIAK